MALEHDAVSGFHDIAVPGWNYDSQAWSNIALIVVIILTLFLIARYRSAILRAFRRTTPLQVTEFRFEDALAELEREVVTKNIELNEAYALLSTYFRRFLQQWSGRSFGNWAVSEIRENLQSGMKSTIPTISPALLEEMSHSILTFLSRAEAVTYGGRNISSSELDSELQSWFVQLRKIAAQLDERKRREEERTRSVVSQSPGYLAPYRR